VIARRGGLSVAALMAFFGRLTGNRILRDSSSGVRPVQSLLLKKVHCSPQHPIVRIDAKNNKERDNGRCASFHGVTHCHRASRNFDRGFGFREEEHMASSLKPLDVERELGRYPGLCLIVVGATSKNRIYRYSKLGKER
jgi:hypothetical protein